MSAIRAVRGIVLATVLIAFGLPNLVLASSSVGAPSNLALTGGVYTNDITPTFTWTAGEGATWYDYKLDNGSYLGIGNITSYTLSTVPESWHTFYLRAHNNSGAVSSTVSLTFEIDVTGPIVPRVTPATATEDKSVTFSVLPYGEAVVFWCDLYVSGNNVGDMEKHNDGTFTRAYTFTNSGSYSVFAHCTDGDHNSTKGDSRTVTVSSVGVEASKGDLIKTSSSSVVYYYGQDGERHAFPNESVFYTWFSNFNSVVTVSNSFMSSLTLGENVTYHPGSVLVKFDSSPSVYAVSEGAVLHAYLNESLVIGDYGSGWTWYLAHVPDSLYKDYSIGSVIDSSSDYNKDTAWSEVSSLDDNF